MLSVTCPAKLGGQVFVGGVLVGRCPLVHQLPPGTYAVEVKFDVGGTWQAQVEVMPGKGGALSPGAQPPKSPKREGKGVQKDATTSADTPKLRWYVPNVKDQKLKWNSTDPWGIKAWQSSVSFSVHAPSALRSSVPLPSALGSSFGLRLGGLHNGFHLAVGPDGFYHLGFFSSLLRGKVLLDLGLPDLQVGLLGPEIRVLSVTDFEQGHAEYLGLLAGARLSYADLLIVSMQTGPGLWVVSPGMLGRGPEEPLEWSAGWSFSLAVGVVFGS